MKKIPAVTERVAPDHNLTVGFVAWQFLKCHPGRLHGQVGRREVFGVEEKPDPVTGLVTYGAYLRIGGRLRQDNFYCTVDTWGNDQPPLISADPVIFKDTEPQNTDIEIQTGLIAGDGEG